MLTVEMLRQSSALTGLTDAQLSAIAEMSKNDENAVIGARIGALHGQYDTDIFSITGIKKADNEKSYDYAKRVLNEYKTKVNSVANIQAELERANAKVTELTQKIEKGEGDAALRQQLKDSKTLVAQLQAQLQAKEAEFATEKSNYEKLIKDTHIDYAFSAAISGLKFKAGITEPIQKVLLNSAKAEILAMGTPDFIDDASGNKVLVLRDKDGNILNNAKNNLNPYTMKELVMEKTSLKDVMEEQVRRTGGGTGGNGGQSGQGGSSVIDLSTAKTQLEADSMIEKHLLANGLTRDSAEFSEQSLALRTENNVDSLPIR